MSTPALHLGFTRPQDTDDRALDSVRRLAARWFVMRNAHGGTPVLLNVRCAMSWLRGPMTAGEVKAAIGDRASGVQSVPAPSQRGDEAP